MGRLPKYNTHIKPHLQKIAKWAADGATQEEIAAKLSIGYSTLQRYILEKEELREALTQARAIADDKVEAALFRRACGYRVKEKITEQKVMRDGSVVEVAREVLIDVPPDTRAAELWLTNRRRDAWHARPEPEVVENGESGVVEMPAVLAPAAPDARGSEEGQVG